MPLSSITFLFFIFIAAIGAKFDMKLDTMKMSMLGAYIFNMNAHIHSHTHTRVLIRN